MHEDVVAPAGLRVTILGANGPTGRLLTEQALAAKCDVVALSRRPKEFPISHPNLVVAGGELILVWLTKPEHELRAQHFDEALQPLGPANVIASTKQVEMRDAHVFSGRDDRLAVSYLTAVESDDWAVILEENKADRYETAFKHEQFLASYDFRARRADEFQQIDGPPVSYAASGWAKDALLLVSETPESAISIYQ